MATDSLKPLSRYQQLCETMASSALVLIGLSLVVSTSATVLLFYFAALLFLISGRWSVYWARMRASKVSLASLLLLALLAVGVSYSSAGYLGAFAHSAKYMKLLLVPLLLAFVVDLQTLRRCFNAFMLAIFAMIVLSYLRYYFHVPIHLNWDSGPATIFNNHIVANMFMSFAAYYFLHRLLFDREKHYFYGILSVLSVNYVLFMSAGRSGYLTFAALGALLCWQLLCAKHWRRLAGLVFVLAVAGVLALSFSAPMRARLSQSYVSLEKLESGDANTSIGSRMQFYKNTAAMVKAHPLLGTGTGSFKKEYRKRFQQKHLVVATHNPHNQYLLFASQLGVIGLFAFLYLFYSGYRYAGNALPYSRALGQGVVVCVAVGCLFNSWLMDFNPGFFLLYFLGLTAPRR